MAGGVRDGNKLKAVIPGGSSMPVLPADVMMELHHGLRRAAEGRFGPGLGRRHRHGRDHLHGQGLPAHLAVLLRRILRPVHAVPRRHRLDVPRADAHRRRQGHARGPASL